MSNTIDMDSCVYIVERKLTREARRREEREWCPHTSNAPTLATPNTHTSNACTQTFLCGCLWLPSLNFHRCPVEVLRVEDIVLSKNMVYPKSPDSKSNCAISGLMVMQPHDTSKNMTPLCHLLKRPSLPTDFERGWPPSSNLIWKYHRLDLVLCKVSSTSKAASMHMIQILRISQIQF